MRQYQYAQSSPSDIYKRIPDHLGKCQKCETDLELSDRWTPSYNNPDNHNCDPESEPYCPKCQPELKSP